MVVNELKLQYRKLLEASVIISLFLVTIFFKFFSWSESESSISSLDFKLEVQKVDLTQQVKRPPPPQRPSVPIQSEKENLLGDETIDDTDIDLEEIPPPPPPPPKKEDTGEAEIFVAYDSPPEMVGGYDFIRRNLKYPDMARQAGIEGRVTVQAVIDENGNVLQADVLKEDGNVGFGQAAVDVVMKSKWKPAKQRDKAVKVRISIPIIFKLKN